MQIGLVDIDSKLALAPMAGVCDLAFRTVCRSFGAGLTYTEMVSAKALVYQDKKTRTLLRLGEDEHPAAVQLFGSDEECLGRAAALAAEISGAEIIDINMGCPVGKVVKCGDGSALMRDPEKARRLIRSVKNSTDCPVTVKIRKGWDKGNANAAEFARMAEEAGASAIAVHGRTRAQMYAGVADWDIIRAVKKSVSIPVLANGDVFTAADAVRILRYTGADMVMIGRGAFGNPWIFSQARAALAGGPVPPPPTLQERVETAVGQFRLAERYKGEKIACLEARKHYAWYLKGVPHAGYFRDRISKIETMADIDAVSALILRDLR
ncbi:tRNA dihydrouridine synthase DusB [Oscillospiraceae bacterium CM]|nr:tRNA dihydrouridine synthase DusB [Oscillospiraceae bacterium CM]